MVRDDDLGRLESLFAKSPVLTQENGALPWLRVTNTNRKNYGPSDTMLPGVAQFIWSFTDHVFVNLMPVSVMLDKGVQPAAWPASVETPKGLKLLNGEFSDGFTETS